MAANDRANSWRIVTRSDETPLSFLFQGWDCQVLMERYVDGGGLSLRLVDSLDGSSIARATVNLPGVSLPDNELLIKDYSENEGLLEALELAGLIVDSTLCMQAGETVLHRVWITPLLDS